VDDKGQEILGTGSAPGTPSVDCSNLGEAPNLSQHAIYMHLVVESIKFEMEGMDNEFQHCARMSSHCMFLNKLCKCMSHSYQDERHCDRQLKITKILIGAFVPQCDEDGKFQPQQVSIF